MLQPTDAADLKRISLHGCDVTLKRYADRGACHLFISCTPPPQASPEAQASAIYRAALSALDTQGSDFIVLRESIFLRDAGALGSIVQEARANVLSDNLATQHACDFSPASLALEQPPLNPDHHLEVALQACLAPSSAMITDHVQVPMAGASAELNNASAVMLTSNALRELHAAAIYGAGESAYEQTHAMFSQAEELLQAAGMQFGDVARTWIHLREMDRDYPELNRARREFFAKRGIQPPPASTGIGAGLVPPEYDLSLGIYALQGQPAPARDVMTTPTLNEAPQYGADFSRGMRIAHPETNALLISGTASLDETGATVHQGDIEAQIDRMLLNVKTLLAEQGADHRHIVSGITYLKDPEHATVLQQKLEDAGFTGFPNNLVQARICRPDLLCETEVLALLPTR